MDFNILKDMRQDQTLAFSSDGAKGHAQNFFICCIVQLSSNIAPVFAHRARTMLGDFLRRFIYIGVHHHRRPQQIKCVGQRIFIIFDRFARLPGEMRAVPRHPADESQYPGQESARQQEQPAANGGSQRERNHDELRRVHLDAGQHQPFTQTIQSASSFTWATGDLFQIGFAHRLRPA